MNPNWILRTARLVLTPVGGGDLADLRAIKADPRVFAIMLGGVRTPEQTAEELAEDVVAWGANGFGMWAIREHAPAASSASPDWNTAPTAAASRCASRYGPRRRAAAWRARQPAPRCASATSGPAAAHRRGRAREQLRLAHGAGRHRHDANAPASSSRAGAWCMYRASLSRLRHLLAHRVDQRVDVVVVAAQIGRVVLALGQAQRRALGDDVDDLRIAGRGC